MKRLKKPSSILQVARLCRPTKEEVKREVLRLAHASPPFSYDDLYGMVWHFVRGFATEDQVRASIRGIGQKIKRDSYLRAFDPASRYFSELERTYSLQVEPRTYSIGRGMRIPCAPPMVCGTQDGQLIPWLMFWQKNTLNEEQMALFVSMALDVIDEDGELEGAQLVIVDTSDKALDKDKKPALIYARDVPRVSQEKKNRMLETFVLGFSLAAAEWNEQGLASRGREYERTEIDSNQIGLGFPIKE